MLVLYSSSWFLVQDNQEYPDVDQGKERGNGMASSRTLSGGRGAWVLRRIAILVLRGLIFYTPRRLFLLFGQCGAKVERLFRRDGGGVATSLKELLLVDHSAWRVLKKAAESAHRDYYIQYLPGILVDTYINWRSSFGKGSSDYAPAFAAISVTGRCNKHCHGCFASKLKATSDMSLGVLSDRLAELAAMGTRVVAVTGGEPFLYRDIVSILANHADMLFLAYTNGGLLLSSDLVSALSVAPNIIPMLSLEGDMNATDSRRGSGSYGDILGAHQGLCERRLLHGLSFTVFGSNIEQVTREETLAGFDCRYVALVQYIELMKQPGEVGWGLPASEEQRRHHSQRIREMRLCKDFAISNLPEDELRLFGRCPAGESFVHLLPDGRVEPCVFGAGAAPAGADTPIRDVLKAMREARVRSPDVIKERCCDCRVMGAL